jgi:hypothetical protein
MDSMCDSPLRNSHDPLADFKAELTEECIFDQSLERRLGSRFKVLM